MHTLAVPESVATIARPSSVRVRCASRKESVKLLPPSALAAGPWGQPGGSKVSNNAGSKPVPTQLRQIQA